MSVADTSRESLRKISLPRRKSIADEIELTIQTCQRRGIQDMSMQEVQHELEARLGRRIDLSTISARVNELVAAKRVVRDKTTSRPCKRSGSDIHPLSIPAQQSRMFD